MAELKVKAVAGGDVRWAGYYGHQRRAPGAVFVLRKEEHFSHLWMEAIGWTPKEKTAKDALTEKEIIRTAGKPMGAKQSGIDKVKGGKAAALSQVAGKVSMDNPVPETVKEVNTEDTSPNAAEEAI